ncbi:MBL fold metallo-hydrolase [uncultured Pseudokineococcus sp.]|uniref:MBL fold metallo-hydrolase n=1 Tax=uncultured Pseudokineococcus sp. TaxID=1642928 RepID=UPI00262BE721|nr:MBL fold metallo-hydrolase [uncultured Pseudokineococcus sp.]
MVPAPDRFVLGDAEVFRVVEWLGPLAPVADLFPDTPREVWQGHTWLAPHFHERASERYRAAVQTWVVRTGGLTVLVDTGVGNDRDRPQAPGFSSLATDFLRRLAAAGVAPEDVDVVVNTHIHYDHVGWNTRRDGDRWVPTFPNATYLLPAPDVEHFHPDNADQVRAPRTEDEARRFAGARLVYADSITPVLEAGQVRAWREPHDLPGGMHLAPAPGHTVSYRV